MHADRFETVAPRRRGTSWLAWGTAILVLLFALGFFVVKPLAERVLAGATGMAAAFLEGIAITVQTVFDAACQEVEQSPVVLALFGEPIVCAPIEETEWLDSQGGNDLELKFRFTGPQGTGMAHAIAVPTDTGFELKSLRVTAPDESVVELMVP